MPSKNIYYIPVYFVAASATKECGHQHKSAEEAKKCSNAMVKAGERDVEVYYYNRFGERKGTRRGPRRQIAQAALPAELHSLVSQQRESAAAGAGTTEAPETVTKSLTLDIRSLMRMAWDQLGYEEFNRLVAEVNREKLAGLSKSMMANVMTAASVQ